MRLSAQTMPDESPMKFPRRKRNGPRVEPETLMPIKLSSAEFGPERRQPKQAETGPYRLHISPASRGGTATLPTPPKRPRRDGTIGNIEFTLDRMSHRLEELRIMLDTGLDDDSPRAA